MKNIFKVTLSLALALCLLLGTIPAVGALWDFSNGVPQDWYQQNTLDQFHATNLLNPVNPNASQESRNLLAYLQLVGDSQQFVTGQFDIDTNDAVYQEVIREYGLEPALYSNRYLVDLTDPTWKSDAAGKKTTVISNTCMDFTDVDVANGLLKKHYDNGNILLVHSDSAPRTLCADAAMKYKPELYNDPTNAIIELDQTNPDREMHAYALWVKYMDNVVAALKKLEAMGVKAYLWRPWVEYDLHAFAGKTPEGYAAFARVYQQTVNWLIDGGLTGFLVSFSPSYWANILSHNPGTDYIDTYAFTVYSDSDKLGYLPGNKLNSTSVEAVRRSGKPLGFSEFSCRTGAWTEINKQARASSFDLIRSALTYWPELAWVNYWSAAAYDTSNNGGDKKGNDDGMLYWGSDHALTLDEIVDYRTGVIQAPGIAQLFTTADASGKYFGLEERAYSNADLKALGINPADVRSVRLNRGFTITFWTGDNCTGDYYRLAFSKKGIPADMAKNFKSLSIGSLENVALNQSEIYASVNDGDAWRMNDGYASLWEADVFDSENEAEAGAAWIYIDLGKPYHVGRYALKNASFANRAEMYNTASFYLQYSNDFENWTTIDTVTNNTLGQVDRYMPAVMAQYFRLVITKPNSCIAETEKGVVSVAEWELYGVDPGLYEEEKPAPEPTTTTKTTTTTKKPTTTTKKVTTTTKKTTKKTTTTTALKLATPKVTVSNATKGVKVSWGKVSKADKYYVYRKTGSGSWSKIKTTTSVSYTDESAKAGKSYQYMVKAVKGSVVSGYKAVSITRLSVPKVTVSNASKGVKVSWGKVTGASKYYVYRKTGSGSWSKIKTTTSTSYTDTKASAGKSYQYMVKAVKGDYTSYYKAASIRRLKAPSSVKLAKATKGFKVSWSKVTGATKYEVYRKTGNGSYTKIATTTKTAYTDKTAKKGKYYTYRVRAVYSSYKSVFKTGSKTKR